MQESGQPFNRNEQRVANIPHGKGSPASEEAPSPLDQRHLDQRDQSSRQSSSTDQGGSVLLVANFAPDVGFAWWLMENFWVELARVARSFGLTPLLVYPVDGPIPETIRAAKIETLIAPFPGTNASQVLRSLSIIRQQKVRCIYFTDRTFSSVVYALFRAAGVDLMITHDHTPGDRPPISGLKGSIKAAIRRVRAISCDLQICVSPLIRTRAILNARIPAERTAVVQNGIPPLQCGGDRTYAHRMLGLPSGSRICITVGRASPYKRIDFVIEVARHCVLELAIGDLCFVHCGDGPDMDRLQQMVKEYGLEDRCFLAGRRSDIPQLLCSSDFALHPARGEGFSLAILEYMSAGLAVLVPSTPSVCQAIHDGENGVVYPEGNAAEAASRLSQLLDDPVRRKQLGRQAAEAVRNHFSLAEMNDSFRTVVSEALSRHGLRDRQALCSTPHPSRNPQPCDE